MVIANKFLNSPFVLELANSLRSNPTEINSETLDCQITADSDSIRFLESQIPMKGGGAGSCVSFVNQISQKMRVGMGCHTHSCWPLPRPNASWRYFVGKKSSTTTRFQSPAVPGWRKRTKFQCTIGTVATEMRFAFQYFESQNSKRLVGLTIQNF